MQRVLALVAAGVVALAGATPAHAAPITGLFNTGVGPTGIPLGDNAADPHYALVAASGGFVSVFPPAPTRTITADGFPIPPWLANSATSRWIVPGPTDGDANAAVGNFIYRTTFDLTGLDPATASISGQWATDNQGLAILLNGAPTGNVNTSEFTTFTAFAINSGFASGLNTLDFVVSNGGGPTGLRVQGITGTAEPITGVAPVPEPATLAAFGLMGAAGFGYVRRRMKGAPVVA